MGSYSKDKYDLKIKSLYELFSNYQKEEIDITINTFKKAFNSLNLLRKKYGDKYNGEAVPFISLSIMEENSLQSFLSRIDTRLKCISYLLKNGNTKEDIDKLFDNKDDNEINIIIRNITAKIEGNNQKKEDVIFSSKEEILEFLKTDEIELKEALDLIDDNDKKLCYIYTYGIDYPKMTTKEICKTLEITKNKYEKYIISVQKELTRLLDRLRHKKEFKKRQLEEKKKEQKSLYEIEEEKINSIINEENVPTTINEKEIEKEKIIEPEITIDEEIKEDKTDTIEEVKEEVKTPEIISEPTYSKTDLLITLYADEIGLDDIEKSNLDPFYKAVLTIAYYDKNNNKKIANLYLAYLQERYKDNKYYLTLLNKLSIIVNSFESGFNVDKYDELLNEEPIINNQIDSYDVKEIIEEHNNEEKVLSIVNKEEKETNSSTLDIYKIIPNAHLLMNNDLLNINIVDELLSNGGIIDLYEKYKDSYKLLDELKISKDLLISIYLKYLSLFNDISEILEFIVLNTNDITIIHNVLFSNIFAREDGCLTDKEKEVIYLKLLQLKDNSITDEVIAKITGLTSEEIINYYIITKDNKINSLNKILKKQLD